MGGATRRSVVAAAAYRSGERLYDEAQGRWFHFTDKTDVVHTEIIAPEGAPAWVFDRQTFWNVVERSEKRKDAQLAREIELTLPRELPREAQVDLVRRFIRDQFVNRGMVADIGIHEPEAADGKSQPHAHVLCPTRELDASTPTGLSAKKNFDWAEPEAIKLAVAEARKRYNNTALPEDKEALDAVEAKRNVNIWRAAWADYANRALSDAGSAARIDHRTLEAQGIARPPQPHLGLVRHIEHAYSFLKDRVTQWVAVKKRASLYAEAEHYKQRDPAKLTEFVLRLGDLAEGFAAQFRRPGPTPEADHER